MATKRQTGTKSQGARKTLGSMKEGKRSAEKDIEAAQTEANDQQAPDQMAQVQETAALPPPATSEVEVKLADATEPSCQMTAEQPPAEVSPAQAASPAPESPSSIESILDKRPLTQRIKEALALVDRVDRQKLWEQLGCPNTEFSAPVTELVELKIVKDDAATEKTLYLLLTEEERKGHAERLARLKGHQQFIDLKWILDHHTYREDYRSWDEFLHHELCVENPHDWWEGEKRRVRIQQLMDERGLKLKVPLNKKMADHLNRVRHDADLFVSCVSEYQALTERQNAKRMGEIVQCHLDRKNKLTSLRQFVPDATEEELGILAPIDATDHRWRNWYPQHTRELQERVQASGRSVRDCMVEMAQEIKALPSDTVLLGVARGPDLGPLVNELMRFVSQWQIDQKKKEDIEKWKREGRRLGIYKPQGQEATQENKEEQKPQEGADGGEQEDEDEGHEDQDEADDGQEEEGSDLYDLDLTGDFAAQTDRMMLSPEQLADLLRNMADSLDDGWVITRSSSLTVRPAVRQEQSA